jgi:hypothetical protein
MAASSFEIISRVCGAPVVNRQFIISMSCYLSIDSSVSNALWRYPMTQPNKQLIETMDKDITYVNWFNEVSGVRDFTTAEIKEVVYAEKRLKKSLPLLLSDIRALLEENKRLNEQIVQERDETGMVNALTDADNLDLRTQLQQTREKLERARKSAKHWQDRYDNDADRLPNAITELEQVKADNMNAEMNLSIITEELSAKDKALEWYEDEGIYDQNEDALVPEVLDDRGKRARTILGQYKGEGSK